MSLQVLRVHHYGETPADDKRITISPHNVLLIAAATEDITVQDRSVRNVNILFADNGSAEVNINHSDLEMLESAIGSFCLD